jgi:hypothetical protein
MAASQWQSAEYDYEKAAERWRSELHNRPYDLWRYSELLPGNNPSSLKLGKVDTSNPGSNLGMM